MFGLRFKVMLSTVVAAALPLAGYFAAEYVGAATRVHKAARMALIDTTERSADKVQSWMDMNRGGLEAMAATPDFLAKSMSEAPEDKAWAKDRMKLGIEQLPWVRASYMAGEDGMQTIRSNEDKLVRIGDRDYFKQARFGSMGQQLVISRTTFVPVLNLAMPMKDKDGKFNGAVCYTIDVGSISDEVTRDKVGKTGFKFMLDEQGSLVAHADKALAQLKNDSLPVYVAHPLWKVKPSDDKVVVESFERDGRKFTGAIARAGGFYVASVMPQDEIDAPLDSQRQAAFLWFAVGMALAMGVAFVMSSVFVKPIKALTDAAEGISLGQFDDAKLDSVKSNDEIGALAKSVKALSNSVRQGMEMMAKANKRK